MIFYMRTTLDIPEDLLEEARRILGFTSKTDTVILSLQELIRRRRIEELKSLMGSVHLEIDLNKSRRRPRKQNRRVS
jgi:Arc/MetJ family transcription regulator